MRHGMSMAKKLTNLDTNNSMIDYINSGKGRYVPPWVEGGNANADSRKKEIPVHVKGETKGKEIQRTPASKSKKRYAKKKA